MAIGIKIGNQVEEYYQSARRESKMGSIMRMLPEYYLWYEKKYDKQLDADEKALLEELAEWLDKVD